MLNPRGEWGCYIPLKRKFYADYEMKGRKNSILVKFANEFALEFALPRGDFLVFAGFEESPTQDRKRKLDFDFSYKLLLL